MPGGTADRARELLNDERWAEARSAAREGLAVAPDDAELLLVSGIAGAELGEEDALGELRRATDLAPDSAEGWRALADALATEGQNEEAAACFSKAAELDPSDDATLASAGAAAFATGDVDSGVRSLSQAAELSSGASSAAINLVDVYRELGRNDEALAMARRVAEAAPEPLALLDVGELELVTGDASAAAATFGRLRDVVDAPSDAAAALHGLIEAKLAAGDDDGAASAAQEALALDPHGRSPAISEALQSGDRDSLAELLAASRGDLRQTHAEDRISAGGGAA